MKYIRLIEITDSQRLVIIQIALRKANIQFETLFENSLWIASIFILGNRGAIISVAEKDVDKAKKILFELGFVLDYDPKIDRFEFISIFDKTTKNIPVLRNFQLSYRIYFLAFVLFSMVYAAIILHTMQFSTNELVGGFWCVEEITYNGIKLEPNTTYRFTIDWIPVVCKERVLIHEAGIIRLPGFNSSRIRGNWSLKSKKVIHISDLQDYCNIYEGEYRIKSNWNGTIDFVSDQTRIRISRKY